MHKVKNKGNNDCIHEGVVRGNSFSISLDRTVSNEASKVDTFIVDLNESNLKQFNYLVLSQISKKIVK